MLARYPQHGGRARRMRPCSIGVTAMPTKPVTISAPPTPHGAAGIGQPQPRRGPKISLPLSLQLSTPEQLRLPLRRVVGRRARIGPMSRRGRSKARRVGGSGSSHPAGGADGGEDGTSSGLAREQWSCRRRPDALSSSHPAPTRASAPVAARLEVGEERDAPAEVVRALLFSEYGFAMSSAACSGLRRMATGREEFTGEHVIRVPAWSTRAK